MYAMSTAAAAAVADVGFDAVPPVRLEDVDTGVRLARCGVAVAMVHDPRVLAHHCRGADAAVRHGGFLVTHKVDPDAMRRMWARERAGEVDFCET
jgi:hypothetical protein